MKTFHTELKPCILLGGFFVSIGFLALSKSIPMALSFIISGILLGLSLYWRVRFEENGFTFFYCNIFPVRCTYSEITEYQFLENQRPELGKFPRVVFVTFRNGNVRRFPLALFGAETANKIADELKSHCHISETKKIKLADPVCLGIPMRRKYLNDGVLFCLMALLCLVFAMTHLNRTLQWDDHLRNWMKLPATLIQGKTLRFQYTVNGLVYDNSKVIYDNQHTPALQTQKYSCIVNPVNPQDSALLLVYSPSWLRFWMETAALAVALCFAFAGVSKFLTVRKIRIPSSLYEYMCSVPEDKVKEVQTIELKLTNIGRMDPTVASFQVDKDRRYGYFLPKRSMTQLFFWAIPFFLAIAGLFFNFATLGCAFIAFFFGLGLFSKLMQPVTIFDFERKLLFRCRNFNPKNPPDENTVPFSSLAFLQLRYESRSKAILLLGVKKDGSFVLISPIAADGVSAAFASIPELAKKLGSLPVLVR